MRVWGLGLWILGFGLWGITPRMAKDMEAVEDEMKTGCRVGFFRDDPFFRSANTGGRFLWGTQNGATSSSHPTHIDSLPCTFVVFEARVELLVSPLWAFSPLCLRSCHPLLCSLLQGRKNLSALTLPSLDTSSC